MKTPRSIIVALPAKVWGRYESFVYGRKFSVLLLEAVITLSLITPSDGFAEEIEANQIESVPYVSDPDLQLELDLHDQYFLALKPASFTHVPSQAAAMSPETRTKMPDRFGATEEGKDYLLPAEEIVGFNILLNRCNYYFFDKQVYGTTLNTIGDNLSNKWVVDTDPFAANQFMHPYKGLFTSGLRDRPASTTGIP